MRIKDFTFSCSDDPIGPIMFLCLVVPLSLETTFPRHYVRILRSHEAKSEETRRFSLWVRMSL